MGHYDRNPLMHAIGGFTAVLATAGTLGVAVLLPMKISPPVQSVVTTAQSRATPAPLDVAATRYRIEVIGSRKANAA